MYLSFKRFLAKRKCLIKINTRLQLTFSDLNTCIFSEQRTKKAKLKHIEENWAKICKILLVSKHIQLVNKCVDVYLKSHIHVYVHMCSSHYTNVGFLGVGAEIRIKKWLKWKKLKLCSDFHFAISCHAVVIVVCNRTTHS